MSYKSLSASMTLLLTMSGALIPCAQAQQSASTFQAAWHAMATADSRAGLDLIADNHPGASAELGDATFQRRLSLARRHVAERLPSVVDFNGYSALMDGLAADFQDGHIWSSSSIGARIVNWAGLIPVRRNGGWYVGTQQAAAGEADLAGAAIIACDGVPFDRLARERIGAFGGNPELESVLITHAAGLLVDSGNPFLTRPKTCSFRKAGKSLAVTLSWRRNLSSRVDALAPEKRVKVAAGSGVARFSGGYWIALTTLEDGAVPIVDAARKQADAIHAASIVVVDLRGNGGGNSDYARALAVALVGEARVNAVATPLPACGGSYWRASAGNLHALTASLATARAEQDHDAQKFLTPVVDGVREAVGRQQAFWPRLPECAHHVQTNSAQAVPATSLPASLLRGRLVLVTDHFCFSSCLIATDLFRKLGALQVGEATSMSTRYMEVREVPLPSGLRTFSTLQKVVVGLGNLGPYQPARVYAGDLSDTAGLQAWISKIAARTK